MGSRVGEPAENQLRTRACRVGADSGGCTVHPEGPLFEERERRRQRGEFWLGQAGHAAYERVES